MFAHRITVQYESKGKVRPCELKWLDSFSMRSFTNDAVFDETLPVSAGLMEVSARVPLESLRSAMEDWFRRKSYIGKSDTVVVSRS